uniref:helix-turn-helix domain-containing protein n=1 Tax=Caballeronia sp. LjRoot34 TaxID=3342325 RepID=UPI003F504497
MESMQQHAHRMMSWLFVREFGLVMLLGMMSAEQRVAALLMNLSTRMKAHGYSAANFNLRMTRDEIGSYLGLKLETVSPTFSKLQKQGVVSTNGKRITIIDGEKLTEV